MDLTRLVLRAGPTISKARIFSNMIGPAQCLYKSLVPRSCGQKEHPRKV